MELAKLKILVELPQGQLNFNDSSCIEAMFNPSRLNISTTVKWGDQGAAKRDNPEQQFLGCETSPLTLELLFDTYDSPNQKKQDVRDYTRRVFELTQVQGEKHRPPVCRLSWGKVGVFFQGVLQQLERQYTMFMEDGTPVRSTVKCTFMSWQSNLLDLVKQNLQSPDVAKLWDVKLGDTLASIAAAEYCDARQWRVIAYANGIENPRMLIPGTRLLLPALQMGSRDRGQELNA